MTDWMQRVVRRASETPLAYTLVLAAVLRLICTAIPGIMLRDDAAYYVGAAWQLARGQGYLLHGAPTA